METDELCVSLTLSSLNTHTILVKEVFFSLKPYFYFRFFGGNLVAEQL